LPSAQAEPAPERVATTPHVLVVDDDPGARSALEELLRADGFAISTASSGEAALREINRARPDLVLTDLVMPGIDGVELCKRVRELERDLPLIVMSAHSDMQSVIGSLRAGAEDFLLKPLDHEAVRWRVECALARRTEKRAQTELYRTLNERLVVSSVREQAHAEAAEQQRAQLGMLLENLGEGVAIGDPHGHLVMLNEAGRAILGADERELAGYEAKLEDACELDGRALERERCPLRRAARGEQFEDYEVLCAVSRGARRRVVFTGTSVRAEDGNVALAIVVFRDVTELRRLEQQREEYLALVSHDLRTPLSNILLLASALRRSLEKTGTSHEVTVAERVEQNVKRIAGMLDELTEATTLESRSVTIPWEACDLRRLVAGAVAAVGESGERRIAVETDGGPPYVVFADASRLERVVMNLLTNALKYSAEDAPVKVRLVRSESTVGVEVADRGIGIDPESIPLIFERRYRTTGGKQHAGGLGLGLYIARLIAEAHGGRIEVSSEVGKGSVFRLSLPLQTPSG
jgi:NtrC-family two-component system sensor histidine kinase KinB